MLYMENLEDRRLLAAFSFTPAGRYHVGASTWDLTFLPDELVGESETWND